MFSAVAASAILSVAMVAAQGKASGPSASHATASAAVTYRGCFGPGSTPDTYVLSNAKEQGKKGKETINLKVLPAPKVKLDFFLTKEVEITGTVEGAVSGSAETGQVVPKMTATKAKVKSDYCG